MFKHMFNFVDVRQVQWLGAKTQMFKFEFVSFL
jgi:hypothetical protein